MKSINFILIFFINIAIALAGVYKVVKLPNKSFLPVRSGPDVKSKMVEKLKLNQYIYATETVKGFKKFYKGYVRTPYLELVSSKGIPYETTSNHNFRAGPSENDTKLKTLKKGTHFKYFLRDPWNNNWAVTDHGYCKVKDSKGKAYIKKVPDPIPVPDPVPDPNPKIELQTTPYYQCDYGDATYGPNGCSLCRSGCLVTSLTMMYNQVKGTSYTPTTYDDQMAFQGCNASRYAPVGTYVETTASNLSQETALSRLLDSLKKNRIAVFGSEGSNTHFVAVYGYTGDYSSPLKPEDFLIHDPSHKDRSRLSQHIANYGRNFETLTIP